MNKKYEFTGEVVLKFGIEFKRIRALFDFGNVIKGELGGWVEKEENLNQSGNAWVSGNARVSGNAMVYGDARVSGDAWVYGDASVSGDAEVSGNARVYGDAMVSRTNHYMCFQSFGSENRTTTIFKTKDSYLIKCGCFSGSLELFKQSILKTHKDNQFALEYLAICEVIKLRLNSWGCSYEN
jgi:hypothetical protein